MPKIPMDYTKEKCFYIIRCKDKSVEFCYGGSTFSFSSRQSQHKAASNDINRTEKLYATIKANGGWDNWVMELIKRQVVRDFLECRQVEQQVINGYECKLNERKAYISEEEIIKRHAEYQAEYRQQNKETIIVKSAEYYQQNKDTINVKSAEYYQQNKDNINVKKAEHYQQNKDTIIVKSAEYYQQNKDTINAKARAKRALFKAQMLCEILDKTNP